MTGGVIVPDWPAPPGVQAFTTTRLTEKLAAGRADRPAAASHLHSLLPGATRIPELRQVHGADVVDAGDCADGTAADACFSRRAGIACRVVTADCLPILLCNGEGGEVAAIHAGWRGLHAGVIEAVLGRLHSPAGELLAWIGPAISQPHYEVGPELREFFLARAPASQRERVDGCFEPRGDKFLADLPGLARARLEYSGIRRVYGSAHCTYADPERFHSWRRDGADAGRLVSLIVFAG